MILHKYEEEFKELIVQVAKYKNIPQSAVERDYYIVLLLNNLMNSEYSEKCVFKGGYPNSIERFSEDIDLTFLGMELSDKICDKEIKKIEKIMTKDFNIRKIDEERSSRSKSMHVWLNDEQLGVKLEIGSNIKPDPFSKKKLNLIYMNF